MDDTELLDAVSRGQLTEADVERECDRRALVESTRSLRRNRALNVAVQELKRLEKLHDDYSSVTLRGEPTTRQQTAAFWDAHGLLGDFANVYKALTNRPRVV
jgi:hypothetical protein